MSSTKKSFLIADILEPRGPARDYLGPSASSRESEAYTNCLPRTAAPPPAFTYTDACIEWPLYCWPTTGLLHPPPFTPALASMVQNINNNHAHAPYDLSNNKRLTSYDHSLNNLNNNLTFSSNSLANVCTSNSLINNNVMTYIKNSNNMLTNLTNGLTSSRLSHLHNLTTNNNMNNSNGLADDKNFIHYNNSFTNYDNSLINNYLTKRSSNVAGVEYLESIKFTTAGGTGAGGRFPAFASRALERRFSARRHASRHERAALATALALTDRQVKTWFQNRRAKWRRSGR